MLMNSSLRVCPHSGHAARKQFKLYFCDVGIGVIVHLVPTCRLMTIRNTGYEMGYSHTHMKSSSDVCLQFIHKSIGVVHGAVPKATS